MLKIRGARVTTGNKKFLSDNAEEGGSINWQLSTFRSSEAKAFVGGSIAITDCSRGVTLDFGFQSHDVFVERMAKLDAFITELECMRSMMVPMFDISRSGWVEDEDDTISKIMLDQTYLDEGY